MEQWTYPPFSGTITDTEIWGRGTIDDKISVIGNLEAVNYLIQEGYQPTRDVFLCFGHDEEIGGVAGALAIVKYLKEKNIRAEFVIDEGLAVTQGLVPGIETDVALVGTAEKGFVTLHLSAEVEGGHSSIPKPEGAIDVISKALVTLKENPFKPELSKPVLDFMTFLGPEMPFTQRMAFANTSLFEPVIFSIYSASPAGNAIIRTTTAPTIIKGGVKENVIPFKASATVNFRTLPGTTGDDVVERVTELLNDERIVITQGAFRSDALQVSTTDSKGFKSIHKTIGQVFS